MGEVLKRIGRYESFSRKCYGKTLELTKTLKMKFKFSSYKIFTFFQNALVGVERNIYEVMQIQHFSRSREDRDYNLLLDNNAYVQNWSLLQVVVIIATTIVQVYFVRKLFDVKSSGYSKTRI